MTVNNKPTVQKGSEAWSAQNQYIERLMENSAYTSAHPDDTLVLAGPARSQNVVTQSGGDALLAIGMLQNFQASQNKPTTPIMSIGSGRQSFVSGKAQTSWGMSRLYLNGRNLLRVLYTNAVQAGINVSEFDDPAAVTPSGDYTHPLQYLNLDSELFLIPFGLAVIFRDKSRNNVGGFYLELCVLNSWNIAFSSGQNFIAENVAGLADRLLPLSSTIIGNSISVARAENNTVMNEMTIGSAKNDGDEGSMFGDTDEK
jgi:hypothetical protein